MHCGVRTTPDLHQLTSKSTLCSTRLALHGSEDQYSRVSGLSCWWLHWLSWFAVAEGSLAAVGGTFAFDAYAPAVLNSLAPMRTEGLLKETSSPTP
eukprot:4917355-Amphidinium_carterae.2